jgi:hypothetical protein
MALPQWTVNSGHSFGVIQERANVNIVLPISNLSEVTSASVISGDFPSGLTIKDNTIIGFPQEVTRITEYNFCVRATTADGIADRTFKMIIEGSDEPEWITPEGDLKVGPVPSGQYWFDTSTTIWGMKEFSGNDFIVKAVEDYANKPEFFEGEDYDVAVTFVNQEGRFYVRRDERWRIMTSDIMATFFDTKNTITTSFSRPANGTADYWWKLGNSSSGFDPKIKKYDAYLDAWVTQEITVNPEEPFNPQDNQIWIQTFANSGIFYVKRYDVDEKDFVLLDFEFGDTAPERNEPAAFILDSSYVNFKLEVLDSDLTAGQTHKFFIADDDGQLPPGLSLSEDGKITGFVDPIKALDVFADPGFDVNTYDSYPIDWGIPDADGYDSYLYDTQDYGFGVPTRQPRKLNRKYQFFVSVDDGVTVARRKFSIYVVGDDFVRADNTITKAADGLFTADATYLRKPLWLTSAYLGQKRANNYITIFLDVYDPNTLLGTITYILEPTNNDGTTSQLPPGLVLDNTTGEIAGRIGYQPESQKSYKFTVRAERSETDAETVEVNANVFEDIRSGSNTIKVNNISESDLLLLEGRAITVENRTYNVKSTEKVDTEDYDLIVLTEELVPTDKAEVLKVKQDAPSGQDYVFVKSLNTVSKEFYTNRFLNFNASEMYEIESVDDYVEWTIQSNDLSDLELNTGSVGLVYNSSLTFAENLTLMIDAFLGIAGTDLDGYVNIENAKKIILKLPVTSTTGNRTDVKNMFHLDDSSDEVAISKTDTFTQLSLDTNLSRTFSKDQQISIGAPKGALIKERIILGLQEVIETRKTFTLDLLGDFNFDITWKTNPTLPSIQANRISTLRVEAESAYENANLVYTLVNGSLPPGLTLTEKGEITGKIQQFGVPGVPGLTLFDNLTTTIDKGLTKFDSIWKFTVAVKDKFNPKIAVREFTLEILDPDNKLYSNLYMEPLLPQTQRNTFNEFVNNANVFTPEYIYRASDSNFGVQKNLRTLAYAGIETKSLANYVGAISKNHKKKKYLFGDVETAVAKQRGSNDVVYEVVYVNLIDPSDSTTGTTKETLKVKKSEKITVDSVKLEPNDDNSLQVGGSSFFEIGSRDGAISFATVPTGVVILTRDGEVISPTIGVTLPITLRTNQVVTISESISATVETIKPFRFRPKGNTITIDSTNVKISATENLQKFIANITNMRKRISEVGDTDNSFLPLWMRTQQEVGSEAEEYRFVLPLAYCKPGTSQFVKENIDSSGFDFKDINYEIDRYIIDSTTGSSEEQYLLFANFVFNV